MPFRILLALAVFLPAVLPAHAGDVFSGPYEAQVVDVTDGDTLKAEIHIWPDLYIYKRVRLCGIDTPEEGEPGYEEASDRLEELAGERVKLYNVQHGKYAGRILADVHAEDGSDIAEILLREGHAQPYEGRKKCRRATPQDDILP